MTLHYHGTPLSPTSELMKLAGKCFCVPFSDARDAERCLQIGQSVMFDNGAFSAFTKGKPMDVRHAATIAETFWFGRRIAAILRRWI